jgi:hypothetical protein
VLPTQHVQENRRAPTGAEFAEQYIELHARPKKKPRSVEMDEALLRERAPPHHQCGRDRRVRSAADLVVGDGRQAQQGLDEPPLAPGMGDRKPAV